MNIMCKNNKISFSLISLFVVQLIILLFSFHWLIKYYQDTLISVFSIQQFLITLGKLGIVSFCFSILIIMVILYQLFLKNNRMKAIFYLNFLFITALGFFILQRLYDLYFMSYNLLIVLKTLVWTDLFYLASISLIGMILGVMIIFTREREKVRI